MPLMYLFIVALTPGVSNPMWYYESTVLGFQPGTFGFISLLYAIGAVAGIWFYRLCFNDPPLKTYFVATAIFYAIVQGSCITVSMGKTYEWFGISPQNFCEIQSFMGAFAYELQLMPLLVLACILSPKKVETTFYALVVAIINLAYLIGYWIGAALAILLHVNSENFDNLTLLIILCSCVPLFTSLCIIVLPNKS